MTTISERLRRGPEKYRTKSTIVYEGPTLQDTEAADTIDALVWVLEKMGDKTIGEYELDAMRRAALAKAKGKQE